MNILIVDDHRIVREGIATLLAEEANLTIVAEAGDAKAAMEQLQKHEIDLAILDVSLPGMGGPTLTRRLVSRYPHVKIVALSMHSESVFVSDMLQAGASGYVLKSSAIDELADAIRVVASGKMYLSPEIAENVVTDYQNLLSKVDTSPISKLSAKEREITQLIAHGHSTAEIAKMLKISPKSVAVHRKNIMETLCVSGVAQLTKLAIQENLVVLDA